MADKVADEILANHPAYENQDRIGNRWFQGRYRPGIREWGYPIRLPSEQWGPLAKMRGGFNEKTRATRSSSDDRSAQKRNDALPRNRYEPDDS